SGVIVSMEKVTVDHIVDIAEIPTAQRKPAIDTSGDGTMSKRELAAWVRTECAAATDELQLTLDGLPAALSVAASTARLVPGQAGLPILRGECSLTSDIARLTEATEVRLVDTAGDRDVGWKEMTANGDGTTVTTSDVPRKTRSARLTAYPKDLLSSPLGVTEARFEVAPGGPRLTTVAVGSGLPTGVLARGTDRLTLEFEKLLERYDGGPVLFIVVLLASLLLGATHAIAPGHGKTIMAFYLSGRREGALRSAATVGATITGTHTAGVLALGLLVSAGTSFAPARLYPWLGVVSGLLVVAVGLTLLRAARRGAPGHTHGNGPGQHSHGPVQATAPARGELVTSVAADPGAHAGLGSTVEVIDPHHEHHPHDHDHDHPHEHPSEPEHTHEVPDLSPRGLVAIGLAGGLLPSPSALIVFLGATGLGHPWFGVALVVAFGLGMATTLAVVGLLVMRLRERAERRLSAHPAGRFAPLLRVVPLVTAASVVFLGAALAFRGFRATGII
ncbi:MAG: sulfite exporter TauE/SafE family protein, partial [Spirochaetaceae bacterium]|nr:sulfite exporter TauE/SafE family protein [Spirochaetaceae bacterium]